MYTDVGGREMQDELCVGASSNAGSRIARSSRCRAIMGLQIGQVPQGIRVDTFIRACTIAEQKLEFETLTIGFIYNQNESVPLEHAKCNLFLEVFRRKMGTNIGFL